MKNVCSDCKPNVNFATTKKKVYAATTCDACGRRGICIKVKK